MGASYGFGIVAGAPIRDVIESAVVEVSPNGDVKQLEGELADSITKVIDRGGSSSYRTFEYLEGYDIAVPGDFEGQFLDDLPGEYEFEVQPLGALRERLDALNAMEEIKEDSIKLHRSLREMCDVAEKLGLPLVTGV